jgi:N-methylhydantoinase B
MRQTGAWSGSVEADGDSFQGVLLYNMYQAGTEMDELTNRSLQLRLSVIPDSGGPGLHRGGAAIFCDELWRVPASQMPYAFKTRELPAGGGVYGGQPGLLGGIWIWDDPAEAGIDVRSFPMALKGDFYRSARPCFGVMNSETRELDLDGEYFFLTGAVDTPAGAITRIVFNAGSGWGNPFDRDAHLVLRDVRDGYVSIEGAARDYGVVVVGDPTTDPEGLALDPEATARLRAEQPTGSRQEGNLVSGPTGQAEAEWPHPTASVEKVAVAGTCPACAEEDLKAYPVLRDGGWFEVVKCQSCLETVEQKRWGRLGAVRLDGEDFLWP